jgi:hypothetical protein
MGSEKSADHAWDLVSSWFVISGGFYRASWQPFGPPIPQSPRSDGQRRAGRSHRPQGGLLQRHSPIGVGVQRQSPTGWAPTTTKPADIFCRSPPCGRWAWNTPAIRHANHRPQGGLLQRQLPIEAGSRKDNRPKGMRHLTIYSQSIVIVDGYFKKQKSLQVV